MIVACRWLLHGVTFSATVPLTLDLLQRGEAAMADLALDQVCAVGGAPTLALDRWAPVVQREPRAAYRVRLAAERQQMLADRERRAGLMGPRGRRLRLVGMGR